MLADEPVSLVQPELFITNASCLLSFNGGGSCAGFWFVCL